MASSIGSSGTLVATTLETAGFYYQSFILNELGLVLAQPVAQLFFVFAAIGGLAAFVLTGRPDRSKSWLVAGSCILFAVLFTRTKTPGSNWLFGGQERNQKQVNLEVSKALKIDAEDSSTWPSPSSLFIKYNNLVSSSIQSIVKVISEKNPNMDRRLFLPLEMASQVRSASVGEARLRQLIQGPFMRECRPMLDNGREMLDDSESRQVKNEAEKRFWINYAAPLQIHSYPLASSWIASISNDYPSLFDTAMTKNTTEVATWLERNGEAFATSGGAFSSAAIATSPGKDELIASTSNVPESITCGQVWNFVYAGLYQYAVELRHQMSESAEQIGYKPNEIIGDLLLTTGGNPSYEDTATNLHKLNRVIANYLLRNEINDRSFSAFMNDYATKGFTFTAMNAPAETDLAVNERMRTQSMEWDSKSSLFLTFSQLPYYQGLLLFFLAVAFPFFALLLVFPSRFMSFTMWFGLWFWVKSWDIGFALIMMLDDMLYGIFALSKQKGAVLDKEFINPALESTLRSLGELDPTFNLSTYHTIIGGCLAAVPVASSYLVLGAVRAGANLISQNIERYGSFLSDRVGRAAANAGGVGGPKRDALDDQGVLGEQLLSRAMGYDTGGGPVPPMSPQQNRTLSDTELAGAKDTGEGTSGGAGLGIGSGGGGGAPNRIGSTTDAGLQEALSRGLSVRSGGHAAISTPQLQAMAMNPASLKATNQFLNVGAGRTEGLNATQKALQEMYFDTGKKINEAEIAEQAGIAAKANADKLRFLQQSIRAIGRKSLPVLFNQSSGNYEERYSLGENLYSADTQSKIAPLKMELAKLGGDPFDVNNSFFYAGIREKEANDRRVPVTSAPVSNVRATSPFGQKREYSPGNKLPHLGVDLAANKGDSVGSLGDGLVVRAEKYLGYGNTVITYLGNGWFSLGAHFDRLAVSRGSEVRGGERIGFAGDSDTDAHGNAPSGAVRVTGPHVHQELIKAYWDPVKGHFDLMAHDPMPYIAAAGGTTVAPSSDPVPLRGMTGEFNRIIEEMRVSFPEKYAEIMSSPPASYFRINVPIAPPGGYGPEAHGEP